MFSEEIYDKLAEEANDINLLKAVLGFYENNIQFVNYQKDLLIDINEYFNYPKKDIIKAVIDEYNKTYTDLTSAKTVQEITKVCNIIVLLYMFNILENFLLMYSKNLKPVEITNDYIKCEVYERRNE